MGETLFWRDSRLEETPLIKLAIHEIPLDVSYLSVKAYWSRDRGWKWEQMENLLPKQILFKLNQLQVREEELKDDLCWSFNHDEFSQ